MTTTQTTGTLTSYPAFRINAGDRIRVDNRTVTVTHVDLVVFYPRNRTRTVDHGVRLSYRSGGQRPFRGELVARNYDMVRTYR